MPKIGRTNKNMTRIWLTYLAWGCVERWNYRSVPRGAVVRCVAVRSILTSHLYCYMYVHASLATTAALNYRPTVCPCARPSTLLAYTLILIIIARGWSRSPTQQPIDPKQSSPAEIPGDIPAHARHANRCMPSPSGETLQGGQLSQRNRASHSLRVLRMSVEGHATKVTTINDQKSPVVS